MFVGLLSPLWSRSRSLSEVAWPWLLLMALSAGCASGKAPAKSSSVCEPRVEAPCAARSASVVAGLRLTLSDQAKEVCVSDAGCAGEPKGATRLKALDPQVHRALGEALAGLGFQLVSSEAEHDMLADVEWRGTDTLALRLQDAQGRIIEQVSFTRSLSRCQQLAELNWSNCWAANFPQLKLGLSGGLQASAPLRDFARRARGEEPSVAASAPAPVGAQTARVTGSSSASLDAATLPDRLDATHVQATVARYREATKRVCWQPAHDARADGSSSAAKVGFAVTVLPSGAVESVTTLSRDASYPRLAPCLASQLQQWQFPAAKNGSTLNIPFVFASD